MPNTEKITAREMRRAIYQHHCDRWAVLNEVTARARYEPTVQPAPTDGGGLFPRPPVGGRLTKVSSERRIDVLLLRGADVPGGIERLAIEIKVSRSDFLSDVKNPDKQAPWRALAHRHAYAVPEGLVSKNEVPAGSGLLVVSRSQHFSGFVCRFARNAVRPPGHDPGPLPLANLMDAFWRAGRAEALAKGYSGDAKDLDEETMRAEITRLREENGRLADQVYREIEHRKLWQTAFGAVGNPPCSTCGKPLKLSRRRRYGAEWQHTVPVDTDMCDVLRHAAAMRALDGKDAEDRYLFVPPPEPAELAAAVES